ncbi:unnamed protein product [Musa acuminata subsp. burmannicoides]
MAASSSSAAESLRRVRILPGKLYFDVPPSKVLVIYSSSYDIAFLGIEKMVPTFLGSKGCHQIMGSTMLNYYFGWYPLQQRIFLELMLIMKVPQVALLSKYLVQNRVLYPYRKQFRIYFGTKTKEYLDKLDEALEVARNDFDPELVVYNAGTDVLGDPLGRLKVCPDGVSTRDESLQICQGKKYTTCYAYIRWLYEVER